MSLAKNRALPSRRWGELFYRIPSKAEGAIDVHRRYVEAILQALGEEVYEMDQRKSGNVIFVL